MTLSRRTVLAATAALAAAPALAQEKPNPRVALTTAEGVIVLELYADKAPVTVANYLKYVDRKLFDGATFYRASRPEGATGPADYGTLQGGLQNDPKKLLPPIAHESTLKTGVKHLDGVISMGRHAPGTATADWFICVGDMSYLDATDAKNPGFAAFGHVVEGMDVVKKILSGERDPKKGEGVMKGEMLAKPVRIVTARRVPATPA